MKRTRSYVANFTRSKCPKLTEPLGYKKNTLEPISATHLYNYMNNDSLIDWLKLPKNKNKNKNKNNNKKKFPYTGSGNFSDFIMERGIEFESNLVKYINDNRVPVVTVSSVITPDSLLKTKELMFQGVPIIHSAPVKNNYNNTQGIIDLLVRSDYLADLVDEDPLSEMEKILPASKLKQPYHYVVIDIKFSTLSMKSDGIHLLNTGSYPAYKAQCLIYTEAVGCIQGFTAPHAFIMGRRWRYTKGGVTNYNYTCLNKLGKIDYNNIDKDYKSRTKKAIEWISDVRKHGHEWSINPPSRIELYPNMCVDSGEWNKHKERISDLIGEMTNIWHVGVKHRNIALEKGIVSWRDKRCNTKTMGISGVRAPIIDAILEINRQNKDKIRPKKIKTELYDWKNQGNEIYVDFETISDIFTDFNQLPEQSCSDMIFMIGVGYEENNSFKYLNFTCKEPTYEEEYRIMDQFTQFLADRDYPQMYHWVAEPRFWNTASCRQFDIADENVNIERKDHISDNWKVGEWADLANIFQSEPIVIKDCFKFGLKSVATAMRKHGMISRAIDSNCDNGMTAMVHAWKSYNSFENPKTSNAMKDIIKYNEFDVHVLWEILSYLRKNNC
jgi:hypothetical protein